MACYSLIILLIHAGMSSIIHVIRRLIVTIIMNTVDITVNPIYFILG